MRIHIYTGDGEGKTLAAFGLALRALGHNKKVVIIQFMKGRKDIGEYKIMKRLCKIYQFGRKEWVNLKKPLEKDKLLAKKGIEFAKKVNADVLILDEINLALEIRLIDFNDVKELLRITPKKTIVVMTGRKADKRIIKMADLVTEMRYVKHPYWKGVKALEGIEY